jgi:hypothetical protein
MPPVYENTATGTRTFEDAIRLLQSGEWELPKHGPMRRVQQAATKPVVDARKLRMAKQLAMIAMAARNGGNPDAPTTLDQRITGMGLDPNTMMPTMGDSDAEVNARALAGGPMPGPQEGWLDSAIRQRQLAGGAAFTPDESANYIAQHRPPESRDPRGNIGTLLERLAGAQRMMKLKGYGRTADPRLGSSSIPAEMGMGTEMVPGDDSSFGAPVGWHKSDPNYQPASQDELFANANARAAAMEAKEAPRRALVQQRAAMRALSRQGVPVSYLQRQKMQPDMVRALLYGQAQAGQQRLGMAELEARIDQMKHDRGIAERETSMKEHGRGIAEREIALKEHGYVDPETQMLRESALEMIRSGVPELMKEGQRVLMGSFGTVAAEPPSGAGGDTPLMRHWPELKEMAQSYTKTSDADLLPLIKRLKEIGIPKDQAYGVLDSLEDEPDVPDYVIMGGLQRNMIGRSYGRHPGEVKSKINLVYGF